MPHATHMNIIGHHVLRARLKKLADQNTLAQSYLFSGPESVGKSLCALELACQLVNETDFQPSVQRPHPVDVMIFRPPENTKRGVTKKKSIGAEAIRDALIFLSQFPATGKYRVVIIEEAHALSHAAQNVLLKALEEPQSTAVILLVTHSIGNIVPTILSRVEKVRFDYVAPEEIESGVRDLFPTNEGQIPAHFFYALGRPGMIIRAMRDPTLFLEEREKLEQLFKLSSLPLSERLHLAEELSKNVPVAIRLLEWWLPGLHTQAQKHSDTRYSISYFRFLEKVDVTLSLLKTTQSNARLLLEKLFFAI